MTTIELQPQQPIETKEASTIALQQPEDSFPDYIERIIAIAKKHDDPVDFIGQIASSDPELLKAKGIKETRFIARCIYCDDKRTSITIIEHNGKVVDITVDNSLMAGCEPGDHLASLPLTGVDYADKNRDANESPITIFVKKLFKLMANVKNT